MKLPVARILLFVLAIGLLVSLHYLEQIPVQTGETFQGLAENVEQAALVKDWPRANVAYREMLEYWKTRQYWIMLNYAEADISLFESTLERIKGGIKAEDVPSVVVETEAAKQLWRLITYIVPKP